MEEFGASSHINGMEDVWPDLNPVEMVDHFAKYEHYDNPPSELGSLERQLGWPGKLSLSELEEFFDAPPGLQLPPQQQQQQPPPVHYTATVHPPAPVMMQHPSVGRENHHAGGGDEVRVTLLHRTRNSQGCEWQVVAPKEEIRVTRNRGKLFKVLVESSAPFTRNDVHLFLADSHHHPHGTADSPPTTSPSAHPSSSPTYDPTSQSSSSTCSPSTSPPGSSPLHVSAHDLVVQSIEEVQASAATSPDGRSATTYSVELKVKLCIIAKGIQIAARINSSQPHQLRPSVGRSVEFMTHNNGKQKLRTEAKKQKQKDKAGGKKKGKRASESPAAGATAAAKGGLKGEPDMSPDRNVAGARGSNDFTGESQSSDSDDDDHHPPRVPLVAPSFYSMGEQQPHYSAQQPTPQQQPQMPVVQQPQHQHQQQQQPLTHHVAPATVSPPVVAQPGGYASGTPTPARRSPFGGPDAMQTHTVNGNNIPGSGLMTMVDPNTGLPHPSSTPAYQQQPPQQAHMGMMPLAGGQAMDDASAFAPTSTSAASMGYGASGVMGNAEDLSDYARGEPSLLLSSNRKRKLGSGGGGGHGGPPRRGAPASGSPQYPDHLSIRGGLHVEGIVRAQGFMQYSDLRLKTNVEDIVDAVSLISKLQGKRYRWKAQEEVERLTGKSTPIALQNNGGLKVIGLIAQQVQQVLPEVVREDEDGFLSVDYVEIIPVLIEAFNQHLESYHREQRELKDEFESWRRLLGDDDNLPGSQTKTTKPGGATKSKPTGKAAASAAKPVLFKEPIGKRSGAVVKTASMDPSSARPLTALSQSEVDIEAAQHVSDEEADSLDRSSSAATTDGELDDDTDVDERRLSTVDAQRDVDVDQDDDDEEEDERPAREEESLLAVDLDRLVANKRHLAALATQMNKLIPDRQYIDLLRYVRDQKKKDTSRNKRLLVLFVVACLVLFAVNVAVAIGVPFGVTYLVENHL